MTRRVRIFCQHCQAQYRVSVPADPDQRPRCPKCGSPTVIPVGAATSAGTRHRVLAIAAVSLVTAAAVALVILRNSEPASPSTQNSLAPPAKQPAEEVPAADPRPGPVEDLTSAQHTPRSTPPAHQERPADPLRAKNVSKRPMQPPSAGGPTASDPSPPAKMAPAGPQPWRATVRRGDELRDQRQLPKAAAAYREALQLLDDELAALRHRQEALRQTRHLIATKLDTVEEEAYPEGYYTSIRHLPPSRQIHRLGAWLLKAYGVPLHEEIQVDEGVVVAIDLSRARERARDLRPLRGIPLQRLDISGTRVSDLAPLDGMPLKRLRCSGAPVRDLEPLRGAPLEELDLRNTKVTDLTPVADAPLTVLHPPPRDGLTDRSKEIVAQLERQGCHVLWPR